MALVAHISHQLAPPPTTVPAQHGRKARGVQHEDDMTEHDCLVKDKYHHGFSSGTTRTPPPRPHKNTSASSTFPSHHKTRGRQLISTHQNLGVPRVFQHHREACHLIGTGLRRRPVPGSTDTNPALARRRPKQGRFSERGFSSSAPDGRRRLGVEVDPPYGASLRA